MSFAHGGTGDDVHRQGQIPGHARDDLELLIVLLAEIGPAGSGDGEQFGHHRGHPVEVAGPAGPFQAVGQAVDPHRGGHGTIGIHLAHRRGEDHIDPGLFGQGQITGHIPGVGGEVLVGPELQRVHENGHRNELTFGPRPLHQAGVTGVEEAHGGNQADLLAADVGRRVVSSNLRDGVDELHGSGHLLCVVGGGGAAVATADQGGGLIRHRPVGGRLLGGQGG